MADFVDQALSLDQPTLPLEDDTVNLPLGNCEACFLGEAVLAVGLARLCESCAQEYAWDRFLDALARDWGQPRRARRTWMSI